MSKINNKNIAVLVSGGGTNLQSIIDNIENGNLKCNISYVIADRKCYSIERAKKHNIKNIILNKNQLKEKLSEGIDKILNELEIKTEYIILAGFLSILTEEFINKWNKKIINIHPSLLPKFSGKGMYGINVHKAVIESGEKESGCSVHYVDSGIDTGEIILQKKVMVYEDDSPEILQKRVLEQEHSLLIEGIKLILEGNNEKKSINISI